MLNYQRVLGGENMIKPFLLDWVSIILMVPSIILIYFTGGYKPGGYGFQQLKLRPNVMGSNN